MFTVFQIILIVLWYTCWMLYTRLFGGLVAGNCVLQGVVIGAFMGDISLGLYLGGTYELMNIGLNPLGGSSVPDYPIGTVVGVAFGAVTNVETGMAVGIVVATLGTTLDVFAKTIGSFFLHRAKSCFERYEFKKGYNWIHIGILPSLLAKTMLPLTIVLIAGSAVVGLINDIIPAWLLQGFQNAGNILPCVGFAILLRSLQIKGNIQYLLIGFFLFAYLGVDALGTAIVGVALAMIVFYNYNRTQELEAQIGGDDDE